MRSRGEELSRDKAQTYAPADIRLNRLVYLVYVPAVITRIRASLTFLNDQTLNCKPLNPICLNPESRTPKPLTANP